MTSWIRLHYEHLENYLLFFCRELRRIDDPVYSSALLKDICGRYNRDLPRMKQKPDGYKKAATAIFWIKKLRPIYIQDGQPQFLNEAFAYYFGIGPVLHRKDGFVSFPSHYRSLVEEMLYALRYRNMTPQNIDFLLKAMYPGVVS